MLLLFICAGRRPREALHWWARAKILAKRKKKAAAKAAAASARAHRLIDPAPLPPEEWMRWLPDTTKPAAKPAPSGSPAVSRGKAGVWRVRVLHAVVCLLALAGGVMLGQAARLGRHGGVAVVGGQVAAGSPVRSASFADPASLQLARMAISAVVSSRCAWEWGGFVVLLFGSMVVFAWACG
jgi:hypothetical protein